MLQIQPRSSTFKKHGLMQVNGVGIIDQDFCGEEDSIKFAYMNMTNKTQHIEKGTRI
jgi:dUTP pyrophosphatase